MFVQGPTLKVEQHTFHIFDRVRVTIRLDDSNIQHQKIRMALVAPEVSPPPAPGGLQPLTPPVSMTPVSFQIPGVSVPAPDVEPQSKKARLER